MESIQIDPNSAVIGINSDPSIKFNFTGSIIKDPVELSLADVYFDGWLPVSVEVRFYQQIIEFCKKQIEETDAS